MICGTPTSIDGLRGEINANFVAMGTAIDHLDRDVAALSRRIWGEPTAEANPPEGVNITRSLRRLPGSTARATRRSTTLRPTALLGR